MVYRIRQIMKHSNNIGVSRESLIVEVFDSHIAWQFTRTLNFDSVVKYADVDVVVETVVPVDYSIDEYFFESL
ncbi:hypothetical protein [Xanthomonas euvesicatoria]|uniref:hypothetical protein n=1 Tax=Xanthomonas euvesicatoria TaxID=456327 RepID=UPI0031BB2B9B